ncbi:hypothetical protein SDC9_59804 [bioreactor metagenome]|uniref:Uncharacterized protein n=1 Tax=bioreactor metagenome TaxID=1076179 RepID=A0A644XC11_9ZZZZ
MQRIASFNRRVYSFAVCRTQQAVSGKSFDKIIKLVPVLLIESRPYLRVFRDYGRNNFIHLRVVVVQVHVLESA